MQFTVLFSPTARVYNLRFLLVVTVATLVYWITQYVLKELELDTAFFDFEFEFGVFLRVILGIVSSAVITVHQVIGYVQLIFQILFWRNTISFFRSVFTWRIRGLAAIDLALLTIEIGGKDGYGEYLPE
jgi:hypothetical protein